MEIRRRRGFGGAVALLTAVRLLSVGAGFLTSVLGARFIGSDGLGLAGAALTLATVAALVMNGGINISTVYFLGRDTAGRPRIAGESLVLGLLAAFLAAAAAAGLVALLRNDVLGGGSTVLMPTAALAAGILLFELSSGILLGLQLRSAYIGVQVVEALGALAVTAVILWAFAGGAAGFVLAAAFAYLAAAAAAILLARRALGVIPLRASWSFARSALGFGLRGQAGNILQFLNLRLDQLLVPALLNLGSAGVYLVAVRISEVVTQVSSSAAAFLFPEVASQPERRATKVTEVTTRLTLLVVVAGALPLAVLAQPILALAFGPEFADGASTVRIMLVAMVPLSLVRLLAGDLKGRGRPGIVSVAALVAVVATIAGDLILIPSLGIDGAALASLVAYAVSAVILLSAYRRTTGGALGALIPRARDGQRLASALGDAWRRRRLERSA
jgi:stage V sporulation protein B